MRKLMRRDTVSSRVSNMFWLIVLVTAFATATVSQPARPGATQKTFPSPGQAVQAMYSAAKANDTDELMLIFGPEAKDVLVSGDEISDKNDRERVVEKYEQMSRLVVEPNKSVTLYLGAENWPFPIPLVKSKGDWYFDTGAGKQEILFRRIGRNETDTVGTLQ